MIAASANNFLLLTQVYPPDPASVGQHMADVAEELVKRGQRVQVLTSDRGYDDPSQRFDRRETRNGVEVMRLPFSSLGKGGFVRRLVGGLTYTVLAGLIGARRRDVDAVLVTTVPPMGSLAAVFISWVTGARINYWVMDVHPDQAVALGLIRPGSLAVRVLDRINGIVMSRSAAVVTLDRFMAARITAKHAVADKLHIVPPWAVVELDHPIDHVDNGFRQTEGLADKRVLMYSGNHGLANPLTTILEATTRVSDLPCLTFLFVGGGVRKTEVEESVSAAVRSLPYVPLEQLRESLSAADVHLVSVGDQAVGVVHPSKVYGAMAVGRPILLLGPDECHVADLLSEGEIGWHVRHGDVLGAEDVLRTIASIEMSNLQAMGMRARKIIRERYARSQLLGRLCQILTDPAEARSPRHVSVA